MDQWRLVPSYHKVNARVLLLGFYQPSIENEWRQECVTSLPPLPPTWVSMTWRWGACVVFVASLITFSTMIWFKSEVHFLCNRHSTDLFGSSFDVFFFHPDLSRTKLKAVNDCGESIDILGERFLSCFLSRLFNLLFTSLLLSILVMCLGLESYFQGAKLPV